MNNKLLEMNLFGACVVRGIGSADFDLRGAKHQALLVLLATAPQGRRTRTFLQDTLWGVSTYDGGRQSLRKALSDLRKLIGKAFDNLIVTTNSDVAINLELVRFLGQPGAGEFLEGHGVRERQFQIWLSGVRESPAQLYSLFNMPGASQLPAILPAVTILPFRLIHGAKDDDIICDWLAEEVCRSLSRSNLVAVISHLSARAIGNSRIDLSEVRDKLGVHYCLSGSMRFENDVVILDADFLDAETGKLLWTRRWVGKIGEIMEEQSALVADLVKSIGSAIASDSIQHIRGRKLSEIPQQKMLIAAVGLMHQLRLKGFVKSKELLDELTRLVPYSAEPHAWLAEWYVLSSFNGWTTNQKNDTAAAVDHVARALDIDPENAFCLTMDGVVNNNMLQRLDIASQRFDAALKVNPNESLSWLFRGTLHAFRDEGLEAVREVEKAHRLSPLDPLDYFYDSLRAAAHLSNGGFDKALECADRSIQKNDRHSSTHRARICALINLGRKKEAKLAGAELLRRQPDFNVKTYLKHHPAADFEFGRMHAKAFIEAGIPKGV